jgi:iron complex transport system ATP-binding protein
VNAAIETENLTIDLSGRRILHGITFSMEPGEYVSVIGPNGAGKTSLIKCLCGIYPQYGGRIRLMNQDAGRMTSRERARLLSYVPQAEGKSFPFTVEEFVLMSRYPHLSPFTTVSADDRAAADRALEQTGTAIFRRRKLATLSGGERQMVFVAAALAQEAGIMILDEPASFLDYRHQAEVFRLLRRLNRDFGHSILTVSHNINTAARCSSRILAIKDGQNIFYGTPEELMEPQRLQQIFDTEFRFIREDSHPLPLVITDYES